MFTKGIRGAITVKENTKDAIKDATIKLFRKYLMTGIDSKTFLYEQKDRLRFL